MSVILAGAATGALTGALFSIIVSLMALGYIWPEATIATIAVSAVLGAVLGALA